MRADSRVWLGLALVVLIAAPAGADSVGDCDGVCFEFCSLKVSKQSSIVFNKDGLSVEASAEASGDVELVNQSLFGLGVTSDGWWMFPDQLTIDGVGESEILHLRFSTPVIVEKIVFGRTDPFCDGDQALLQLDSGGPLLVELDHLLIDCLNLADILPDPADRTTEALSFTTHDKWDNYKVKEVCVRAVPTPAAALGGTVLLGLLALGRRRS